MWLPGHRLLEVRLVVAQAASTERRAATRLPENGDALAATGRPIVYSLCEYAWVALKMGADVTATCGAPPATSGRVGQHDRQYREAVRQRRMPDRATE